MKKHSREKGALTIEACIAYSIFMMVLVTFLYIIRIVYTFGLMQHAVSQTAKELSAYTYLYQVSGISDLGQGLVGGTQGRTDQFNEDVESLMTLYETLMGGDYANLSYEGTTNPVEILKNMGAALTNHATKEAVNLAFGAIARPMISGYIGDDSRGNSPEERLNALRVIGGVNGLDLSKSHFFEDGETIDLVVCYTIDPIFPIDIVPELHLMNRAYVKGMKGTSVFK